MQDGYMQNVRTAGGFSLDPRTKLILALATGTPAFIADSWYVLAFTAAIPLSLLLFEKKYFSTFILTVLYVLSLLTDVFLIDATSGAVNVIMTMASGVMCRMMPCILMGYVLLTTTMISEFVAAMERMHMPKQIIIPLSVMFRFFPTINEESSSITAAMKMRGVSLGKTRGGIVSLMEYRLIPLFISCVKIGDELSISALTRGLGSPVKRTNICKVGFSAIDIVYISLAAVTVALFILADGGGR